MGLRAGVGDVALTLTQRGAGTYTSGPIAAAGTAADMFFGVHATAVSGTPTLDVSLEQSADGASWSAITGSAVSQLTAAGNRVGFASVSANFVRVTATVGGTATPTVTFRATALLIPE